MWPKALACKSCTARINDPRPYLTPNRFAQVITQHCDGSTYSRSTGTKLKHGFPAGIRGGTRP